MILRARRFQRALLATLAATPNDERYLVGAAMHFAPTSTRYSDAKHTWGDQPVMPRGHESLTAQGVVPHYGAPGGVLSRVADAPVERPHEGG